MGDAWIARQQYRDPAFKAARAARIEELENEVMEHAAGVVHAILSFAEIDPNAEDPPQAWIDELGEEAARQKLKVAKAGWWPSSQAPRAFDIATRMVMGISRGRQHRMKVTQNNLNVQLTLSSPTSAANEATLPVYEVRELET